MINHFVVFFVSLAVVVALVFGVVGIALLYIKIVMLLPNRDWHLAGLLGPLCLAAAAQMTYEAHKHVVKDRDLE